ncbi:hypothetical protein ABVK25_001973 [Lepraria finkii]|uniref:Uncharacterized protein n=1 Tax=Lepraria finkii TaxID=1340010 RepID=A0ABR4BLE6_9LECA
MSVEPPRSALYRVSGQPHTGDDAHIRNWALWPRVRSRLWSRSRLRAPLRHSLPIALARKRYVMEGVETWTLSQEKDEYQVRALQHCRNPGAWSGRVKKAWKLIQKTCSYCARGGDGV